LSDAVIQTSSRNWLAKLRIFGDVLVQALHGEELTREVRRRGRATQVHARRGPDGDLGEIVELDRALRLGARLDHAGKSLSNRGASRSDGFGHAGHAELEVEIEVVVFGLDRGEAHDGERDGKRAFHPRILGDLGDLHEVDRDAIVLGVDEGGRLLRHDVDEVAGLERSSAPLLMKPAMGVFASPITLSERSASAARTASRSS
jgi:hypothetical protein